MFVPTEILSEECIQAYLKRVTERCILPKLIEALEDVGSSVIQLSLSRGLFASANETPAFTSSHSLRVSSALFVVLGASGASIPGK